MNSSKLGCEFWAQCLTSWSQLLLTVSSEETVHLPLPKANINTYFSLRAKCWLRGGVGGQFPRNLNWSNFFFAPCRVIKYCLGLGIPRRGFRTLWTGSRITCQCNMDLGFQSLAGSIPAHSVCCIPDFKVQDIRIPRAKSSWIPESTKKKFLLFPESGLAYMKQLILLCALVVIHLR